MTYVQIKLDFITDQRDAEELIRELQSWHLNNSKNMSKINISASDSINLPGQ